MSDQSVPMLWRRIKQVYNLTGRRCRTCDTKYFPPVPLCPKCRRKSDLVDHQFSGLGKIYSYTIIHDPPAGFKDLVELLIATGADVNTKDNWDWSPLHSAVYQSKDMVKLLIARGANVNARDGGSRTPLWYAEKEGYIEIAELLKKHGAKE